MHHGENVKEWEDPNVVASNRKLGLILFAIYGAIYALYVLVNTFAPEQMDEKWFFEVNNAIVAGFGLILLAIVIAFAYGLLCRSSRPETASQLEITSGSSKEKTGGAQ